MKKRFLIPSIAIAALTGLAVYGINIQKTCVPGNLDYRYGTGLCTSKNLKSDTAKAAAKAADKPVKKLWQPNRSNVPMLAYSCAEKFIKPALRDPNSFRELGHSYSMTDTHVTITVSYTATNGFGGRVRNTNDCTYSR